MNTLTMTVIHDRAALRFRLPLEGGADAILAYAERGPGVLELRHTEVPPHARGKGHGSNLVEQVLRYAREEGLRVVPSCPFVAEYVRKHREFADLVG
jgi:predicted GNAT family acetyltransferase